MIIGLGIDIVSIREMEDRIKDTASAFIKAHFTEGEVRYCKGEARGLPPQHFAARYAAKEATVKAFDQARRGLPPIKNIDYCEIEMVLDKDGRPSIKLHGGFAKMADAIGIKNMLLSVSHDGGYAIAAVVLETT